jgi:3'-5' exoribonuclease
MKEQFVRDLPEGARVDSLFALRSRDIRSARTGEPYLALEIGDSSGCMSGVMFRPASLEEALPVGSVVRLRGTVTTYRGVRRVTVDSLLPAASFDPADMLPSGTRDREEMLAELRALVRRVREPRLRAVVRAVFGAPGFIEAFAACPADVSRHHAYVGGLLEHTVSVATLCVNLAACYPQADSDLLLAAALLHDVGKTEGLTYGTSIDYTDAGRLVGHAVLGERIVSRAIQGLARSLPDDVGLRLLHAMLARGGTCELAELQGPSTLEALLLHHADDLDARASSFLGSVAGAAVLEQEWSDGTNVFGRPLMVPCAPPAPERERTCA